MIGIAMDMTERRLLEDHLRSAHKLESIGLLAGGIAHDFNNLLTGILGNASLAQELAAARARAVPLLSNVVNASERAADLTQQLLAYSGKARFVSSRWTCLRSFSEITHLLQATIPKRVKLELDLAPGLPAMEADSSQVQQVIMNLVINAAEAIGDRPGAVTVRTSLRRRRRRGRFGDSSPATMSAWKCAMTAAAWTTPPRRASSTRSSPQSSPAGDSGWPQSRASYAVITAPLR